MKTISLLTTAEKKELLQADIHLRHAIRTTCILLFFITCILLLLIAVITPGQITNQSTIDKAIPPSLLILSAIAIISSQRKLTYSRDQFRKLFPTITCP